MPAEVQWLDVLWDFTGQSQFRARCKQCNYTEHAESMAQARDKAALHNELWHDGRDWGELESSVVRQITT